MSRDHRIVILKESSLVSLSLFLMIRHREVVLVRVYLWYAGFAEGHYISRGSNPNWSRYFVWLIIWPVVLTVDSQVLSRSFPYWISTPLSNHSLPLLETLHRMPSLLSQSSITYDRHLNRHSLLPDEICRLRYGLRLKWLNCRHLIWVDLDSDLEVITQLGGKVLIALGNFDWWRLVRLNLPLFILVIFDFWFDFCFIVSCNSSCFLWC